MKYENKELKTMIRVLDYYEINASDEDPIDEVLAEEIGVEKYPVIFTDDLDSLIELFTGVLNQLEQLKIENENSDEEYIVL